MLTGCLWSRLAQNQRVTHVSRNTTARGCVVYDMTFGIQAAHSNAWVHAFIIDTRLMLRTLAVQNTLRSTASVGVTQVFCQTSARSGAIAFFADSVCAAR